MVWLGMAQQLHHLDLTGLCQHLCCQGAAARVAGSALDTRLPIEPTHQLLECITAPVLDRPAL
jgi:hypothetical protein